MTRRVLVTGASGFMGRPLVDRLARSGWSVVAASRDPASIKSAAMVDAVANPRESGPNAWTDAMRGVTHVVHLAGLAHTGPGVDEQEYQMVNARLAGDVAAAAAKAKVARFVLMSSVRAQSGPTADAVLDETTTPEPTDAYGRSKLEGERQAAAAFTGGETGPIVLRPVVVYGPGAKANMRILERIARSPLPVPFGKLTARRSLLSLENLVSAVEHALVSPNLSCGGAYLVADAGALTMAEIIAAMRAGLGRQGLVVPVPGRMLSGLARAAGQRAAWERLAGSLVVDTARLRATGWTPKIDTASGLYEWMRTANSRH